VRSSDTADPAALVAPVDPMVLTIITTTLPHLLLMEDPTVTMSSSPSSSARLNGARPTVPQADQVVPTALTAVTHGTTTTTTAGAQEDLADPTAQEDPADPTAQEDGEDTSSSAMLRHGVLPHPHLLHQDGDTAEDGAGATDTHPHLLHQVGDTAEDGAGAMADTRPHLLLTTSGARPLLSGPTSANLASLLVRPSRSGIFR